MITKTITSIAIIIAVASMFISSSAIMSPILAKTTSHKTGTDTTSGTKTGTDTTSGTKTGTDTTSGTKTGTDTTSGTKTGTDTTSGTKTGTDTNQQDFKDFQKCLSNAKGTKGFAVKSEIQDCFKPIYTVGTSPSSISPSSITELVTHTKLK